MLLVELQTLPLHRLWPARTETLASTDVDDAATTVTLVAPVVGALVAMQLHSDCNRSL
jgi:hypothetical protein